MKPTFVIHSGSREIPLDERHRFLTWGSLASALKWARWFDVGGVEYAIAQNPKSRNDCGYSLFKHMELHDEGGMVRKRCCKRRAVRQGCGEARRGEVRQG